MVEQFVRESRTLRVWVALLAATFLTAALPGCSSDGPGSGADAAPVAEPVVADPVAAVEEPPVEDVTSAGSETAAEVDQPVVDSAHADTPAPAQDDNVEALLEAKRRPAQAPAGLIVGLDGAEYPAYAEDLILEVKRALTDKELYSGILDGVLDDSTMAAIARFQQMNELHASGVPSPQTRELLTAGTAEVAVEGSPSSG